MMPKTDFIEVLENIHSKTSMRYGQIINNALQLRFGRPNESAKYDTFYLTDEDFTDILKAFSDYCV